MEKKALEDLLKEIAEHCDSETTFVQEVIAFGLLPDGETAAEELATEETLSRFRRIRRLNATLGINLEGVEVVLRMREQLMRMQDEIRQLRRELDFYRRLG